MQDEARGLGTPLRPGQRAQLEKCPVEVRPALRHLYDRVFFAHGAHQERGHIRRTIATLRQRLASDVDESEAVAFRMELRTHKEWLARAQARCEEIDQQVSEASAEYTRQLREWRLRGIPEERREEAFSILQEEAKVLGDAWQAFQAEARKIMVGTHEGESRLSYLSLFPGTDRAVPDPENNDVPLDGIARIDNARIRYSEICETIREEHDRRLRALADGQAP